MRRVSITILLMATTALVSVGGSAYVFYNKWQSLRATLESVKLSERIDTETLTLAQASEKLVEQVRQKKGLRIRCVFAPPDLRERRSITRAHLDGTAYFGLKTLEVSYGCRAELAENATILFAGRD